jgi:hypothetical protein
MSSMLFGENFLSINSSAKFFRGLSLVRDQRSARRRRTVSRRVKMATAAMQMADMKL